MLRMPTCAEDQSESPLWRCFIAGAEMATELVEATQKNLASAGTEPLPAGRIAAPSSPYVLDTRPINAKSRQAGTAMASMTSTMQLARSAVPARSASRSCPAATQSAIFGSRLAVRPAAAQVTRFRPVQKRPRRLRTPSIVAISRPLDLIWRPRGGRRRVPARHFSPSVFCDASDN